MDRLWPWSWNTPIAAAAGDGWRGVAARVQALSAVEVLQLTATLTAVLVTCAIIKYGSEKLSELLRATAELIKYYIPPLICASFCVWLHARYPNAFSYIFAVFDTIGELLLPPRNRSP